MNEDEMRLLEDTTDVQVVVTIDNPVFKRDYMMTIPFTVDEKFEYTVNDHISKSLANYIIDYQDAKIQMAKEKEIEAELRAKEFSEQNGGITIEDLLKMGK